jgi:ribosomal protein S18 acetylase RimI-like enzyme
MLRPVDVRLRFASKADDDFIVEMARYACVIEDWPLPDPDSEETRSMLPGDGDVVIVATDASGIRLGAIWTFQHDPPLLVSAAAAAIPELSIAVAPEFRGEGVGGMLLDELAARCTGRYKAISLNVHVRNPAAHLYERKGFEVIGQGRGALGVTMRKNLD